MKNSQNSFCLSSHDEEGNKIDFDIYGNDELQPHRRIDLSFMPCTPVVTNDPNVNCSIATNSTAAYNTKLD